MYNATQYTLNNILYKFPFKVQKDLPNIGATHFSITFFISAFMPHEWLFDLFAHNFFNNVPVLNVQDGKLLLL